MRKRQDDVTTKTYRAVRAAGILLRLVGFLLALSISLCATTPQEVNLQPDEYQVKAAYIYHFAQLLEWPTDALKAHSRTIDLCVVGDDPFRGDLESIEGKPIGSRVIHVRHIKKSPFGEDCQLVFVGKNEAKRIPLLLSELRDSPVFTVGETETFVKQGGMINFCLDAGKIRFEINLQAAEDVKLKISSRLLLLAKSVNGAAVKR